MNVLTFPSESELQIEALFGSDSANGPRDVESIHALLIALETFREDVANAVVGAKEVHERIQFSKLHAATIAARTTVLSMTA